MVLIKIRYDFMNNGVSHECKTAYKGMSQTGVFQIVIQAACSEATWVLGSEEAEP